MKHPHKYRDVRNCLVVSIMKEFAKLGVKIPYPQMDVHINYKKEKEFM